MTNYQIELFSKMVNLNWEINVENHSSFVKNALIEQYWKVRQELIEDMGEVEFKEYMRMGREMFVPAN